MKPDTIDADLFARFTRVGGAVRIFRELLTADAAEQQNEFLAGELRNPDLFYEVPGRDMLQAEITALAALQREVPAAAAGWPSELAAPLAKTYAEAIAEATAERQLLLQGYSKNRPFDAQAFMAAETALYGEVQPRLFWYSMQSLGKKVSFDWLKKDGSPAANELVALFERAQREAVPTVGESSIPQAAHAALEPLIKRGELEALIRPNSDGLVDMIQLFTAALDVYGARGWKVVHRPTASNLAVITWKKEVIVNDAYHFLSPKAALSRTLHEIGVHVRRSVRQSNVALYNAGLPHYHRFEEGFACVIAGLHEPQLHINGQRLYVGIGLACGTDGTPRDFRDVFELLWRIDAASGVAVEKAKKVEYRRSQRLFRGAQAAQRGACHLRDTSYVEGIFAALDFFATTPMTQQSAADLLDYRFIPTDAAQAELVAAIK